MNKIIPEKVKAKLLLVKLLKKLEQAKEKGFKQRELAKILGVDEVVISRMLKEKRDYPISYKKVLEYLDKIKNI